VTMIRHQWYRCALAGLVTVLGLSASEVQAVTVAVFDNSEYVDTDDNTTSESDTLQASLMGQGYTASAWSTAGGSANLIAVPELESGDLAPDMSPDDEAGLRSYVENGGSLLVMGAGFNTRLLNTVFGWGLQWSRNPSPNYLLASGLNGTVFEGGPASLASPSSTSAWGSSSLPALTTPIYQSGNGFTTVFVTEVGSGQVGVLGWDWFNAAPLGSVGETDWLPVLDSMVQSLSTAPSPAPSGVVPEPASAGLLGVGLLGLAAATRRRRVA